MRYATLYGMEKKIIIVLLVLFNISLSAQQNFALYDSVKVPTHHRVYENGEFIQIHSFDTIGYFWQYIIGQNKNFNFFTYTPYSKSFNWYKIPLTKLKHYYPDISAITDATLNGNNLILLGDIFLYWYELRNGAYFLRKQKRLKYDFGEVYFLDNQTLLLASTYDYVRKIDKRKPWDNYRFAVYNLKKSKITKFMSIDAGRIINLSHFANIFQGISVSHNNIAITFFSNGKVFLYDHNLKLLKTILVPDMQFNTDSVFKKVLTDSVLYVYRTAPSNKMDIIRNNDLFKYPMIQRVAFINDTLLMIDANTKLADFSKKRRVFIYNLNNDSLKKVVVTKDNKNIPPSFFFDSEELQFNRCLMSSIRSIYDDSIKGLSYYLKLFSYLGSNNVIAKDSLPELYDFQGNRVDKSNFDFRLLFVPGDIVCTHCYTAYENRDVLILVKTRNKTANFKKSEYFKSIFPKGHILFYNTISPSIPKNKVVFLKLETKN